MATKKTWNQLSKGERIGGIIGLCIAVVLGLGLIGTFVSAVTSPHPVKPAAQTTPVTTYTDIQQTETIPFEKITKDDPTRDVGTTAVTTAGVNGVRTKTYHVTYVDGKETARVQTKDEVTTPPVTEVTSVGSHVPYVPPVIHTAPQQPSGCDPNYSGCVPIASDVDCAGGSGNGPAYVAGPVQVIGTDIYDLDRDGDGVGCE